jgi:hypothetical protein
MSTSRRCRCHICRPERLADPLDRRTVDDVGRQGVSLIAVGTGECDCGDCDGEPGEGPAFAYTIGLPHSAGHPELVVSGLRPELMGRMLQSAASRVLDVFCFSPGTTAENLLGFWPVVADPLSDEGLEETVLWSRWFHRGRVDALQLVWPSTSGIFPWQPGASRVIADAQPQHWRLRQARVGAVAQEPPWLFPVPPEGLAVACGHIVEEGAPVLAVIRLFDARTEQWHFSCDRDEPHLDEDWWPYHFAHLTRRVPSLLELHDLAPGEEAFRTTCWSPWVRRRAVAAS